MLVTLHGVEYASYNQNNHMILKKGMISTKGIQMLPFDVFDRDMIVMHDRRNDPKPVLKPILGPQHLVTNK